MIGALVVALATGLRIATEMPDRQWINLLDAVLPREHVWTAHMQAAIVILCVSIAYAVYIFRSGLTRRVRFDGVRARALLGSGPARLGAVSILLYWVFFVAMLSLTITGGLMYFGVQAGYDVYLLHWIATWAILGFVALHVTIHGLIGGLSQLLRIIRPTRLTPPSPPLDPVELLIQLADQRAQAAPDRKPTHDPNNANPDAIGGPSGAPPSSPRRRPHAVVQANPLAVAASIAIAGTAFVVAMDQAVVDTLKIHRITATEAPLLDGETSDPIWHDVTPLRVITNRGGNFDDRGETRIEIRAVHDGTWAYFLFVWDDSTRSLKQLPLVKTDKGWMLLHEGHEIGDEHKYNEDKFSVLLTTLDVTLAGDRTFHASPKPLADAPATTTGRGLHYTADGKTFVDVWQWKATSTGAMGWMDDDHFGPPAAADAAHDGSAYRGGFSADPGESGYADNFVEAPGPSGQVDRVTPRRLPRDPAAMAKSMGPINLDPDHGDGEQTRWFMTEQESMPYSVEADSRIPNGTVIPGVIVNGQFSGDRADIRCAARWATGRWALEVARKLDTQSPLDVAIASGVFMRVAAFDHSQIQHTRHVRPIRIEVQ
jgi:hypothetical protein